MARCGINQNRPFVPDRGQERIFGQKPYVSHVVAGKRKRIARLMPKMSVDIGFSVQIRQPLGAANPDVTQRIGGYRGNRFGQQAIWLTRLKSIYPKWAGPGKQYIQATFPGANPDITLSVAPNTNGGVGTEGTLQGAVMLKMPDLPEISILGDHHAIVGAEPKLTTSIFVQAAGHIHALNNPLAVKHRLEVCLTGVTSEQAIPLRTDPHPAPAIAPDRHDTDGSFMAGHG